MTADMFIIDGSVSSRVLHDVLCWGLVLNITEKIVGQLTVTVAHISGQDTRSNRRNAPTIAQFHGYQDVERPIV